MKDGKRQPYERYQALHSRKSEPADDVGPPDSSNDVSTHVEGAITSAQADLDPRAKLACQRESPLTCPNQELVEQIDVLKRARELDLNWQSALSYARAIAVSPLKRFMHASTNLDSPSKVGSYKLHFYIPDRIYSLPQENPVHKGGRETLVCREKDGTEGEVYSVKNTLMYLITPADWGVPQHRTDQ